jgi:hypothetical protein
VENFNYLGFILNADNIKIAGRIAKGNKTYYANIDKVWRIQNNMEIDKLIDGADIVRFIKVQRIKWLRHIQRMDRARPTGKLPDWKPMGTRPVGRPRQRWQENVVEDLKKLKVKNWKASAKGGFTHSMPCPCRARAMPCR